MKNKKSFKTNEDVLNIVYKISDKIEYEIVDEDRIMILEKQDHKIQKILRKIKFKIPKYKKTTLDELSSFVFQQIDGIKNVKEIGELVEKKFPEQSMPLYENLLLFLNHIEVNSKYIVKK